MRPTARESQAARTQQAITSSATAPQLRVHRTCISLSRLRQRLPLSRYLPPLTSHLSSHPSPSSASLSSLPPSHPTAERDGVMIIALRACTDGPSEGCAGMYNHADQRIQTMPRSVPWLYKNPRICLALPFPPRFFSPTSHPLASFPFSSPSPRAALLVEVQHALPSSCSRRPDGPCVGSYFKSHPIVIRDAPGRSFVSLCNGLQRGVAGASAGSGCSSQVVRLLLWEEGSTSRPRPRSCRASGRRRCGHALAR